MTQRLPTPGGDNNDWGTVLNDFLAVSLASDGSLNSGIVGQAQLSSGTQAAILSALQQSANLSDLGSAPTARANLGLGSIATLDASVLSTIVSNAQASSYILALSDEGGIVDCTAATAVTITVPPNSSVAFTVGSVIEVCQYGAGQVTVAPGAGVTLRTSASLTSRAQYSTISLRQRAVNEWIVGGDLT